MLHNLGLYSLSLIVFSGVLLAELAIAARLDKRRIHARRELTRQM